VVARLSLSYVPSLCLSSALSHCLCAVRVLCHMGLAACNKFFVRSFVLVSVSLSLISFLFFFGFLIAIFITYLTYFSNIKGRNAVTDDVVN